MNFIPPLKRLALIKLAISIYNSSEFLESKEKSRYPNVFLNPFPVKQLFRERLLKSTIPTHLCKMLLDIILPIIMDIESWNKEKRIFGVRKQLDICLTSSGTIDRQETAKKFVRSEDQYIVERFALACHFWMTDDVLKMWNKISVYERKYIEKKLLHTNDGYNWKFDDPHKVTKVDYGNSDAIEYLKKWFDWLHDGGDPCKQHYFLNESSLLLSYAIPEPNVLRALPSEKLREIIKFKYQTNYGRAYFSCLDYNQKLSLFKQEPFMILHDYLKWPLQFKFLEMASQAWKYMTGKDFYSLLWVISEEKMSPRSVDFESGFDYEGLLHEFWKQSPHHLKISAKEQHDYQRRKESPLRRLLDSYPSAADHLTKKMRTKDM